MAPIDSWQVVLPNSMYRWIRGSTGEALYNGITFSGNHLSVVPGCCVRLVARSNGLKSACSRWSLGSTKWPTRAAPEGKPSYGKPWRLYKSPLAIMRSPNAFLPRPSKSGKPGLPSGCTPFSAPRQPWRAATVPSRNCITISGACQSTGTRCGRCCITSIVVPRTGPHPPHGFSGTHFRTSLKRY